jgi:hypothetical protein
MTDTQPIGSVIIPAWNEAAVIGETLAVLFDGIEPALLDVVVACNGCVDDTATIARQTPARVLDLPAIGKAMAIRAAEDQNDVLPRLYLDADVLLPGPSALAVLTALADSAIAARPPRRYDSTGATWLVRRYFRQRARLGNLDAELCGAGVYGLSRVARSRFDEFPAVTADDLFAARVVSPAEVTIVDCPPVIVRTPRTARALVATTTRAQSGNRELEALLPDIARPTGRSTSAHLVRSVRRPGDVVDATVYAAVALAARLRARLRPPQQWKRDETSRSTE